MRHVFTIVLMLGITSVGQPSPAKQTRRFQWNGENSQTAKSTLSELRNINAQDRTSLKKALVVQYKGHSDPKGAAGETRFSLVDLNGDRVPEVIAQASGDICSPTGNCPFWVFRKQSAGYTVILSKGAVQGFTIQETKTSGFSDLVLEMHGSATMQELFLYKFRDGRYRRAACYDANWTYIDNNDEMHDLKEPRITPCANR